MCTEITELFLAVIKFPSFLVKFFLCKQEPCSYWTYCGSCTAEVEFEFTTWVPLKATANFHSCSGQPSFLLFVYVCKWVVGKKPLPEWQSTVASGGGLNSGLRRWTQTLHQPNKKHNLPLAYMRMNPGYSFSLLERKTTVRMLDVESIPSSVMLPHASSKMAPVADVPVNQRCDELTFWDPGINILLILLIFWHFLTFNSFRMTLYS